MPARAVRSREAIRPDESFLEFTVYRSPDSGRTCGYLNFGHQSPALQAPAYTPFALSLEEAWDMACQFVREHRVQVLWVNDPENLSDFPEAIDDIAPGSPSGAPS